MKPEAAVRNQARSMSVTRYGIVATSQTLASAAGAKILEAGGSAVDAAIAANAVLGLVEPNSNGIGGDLFAIVSPANNGKLHGLNASGWAPFGVVPQRAQMPQRGIHSVTVPGAVSGWEALHQRFGCLALGDLLAPAIHYATEGFPVTEIISEFWTSEQASHGIVTPEAIRVFLPNGRGPAVGEIFRNPDLARSLERIAVAGAKGFYEGPIADAIVQTSQDLGGAFNHADLAEFQAEWVEPISTTYRGWTVTELPPNSQGVAVLAMLNRMEQFPLAEYGPNSAQALHIMIEAKKVAYADLIRRVGDPRFAKTPGADTVYLAAVDRDGNMVSFIQSNYNGFGSGIVPVGTGFGLQNRGALFTTEPGHPNQLAPRKRPLHTIIPGFLSKDGVRIAFGIMGGWNQAQAHAQYVSNIVDHGMNIQAAMEAPRFTKLTFEGSDVQLESRIPESTRSALTELGHEVCVSGPYCQDMGGGQAVLSDERGVHYGASDPRKDGAAIPESPAWSATLPQLRTTAESGPTPRAHSAHPSRSGTGSAAS